MIIRFHDDEFPEMTPAELCAALKRRRADVNFRIDGDTVVGAYLGGKMRASVCDGKLDVALEISPFVSSSVVETVKAQGIVLLECIKASGTTVPPMDFETVEVPDA